MLVRLNNVTMTAGGHDLLRGVNLTVQRGEALRLAGPNGGGKTTLLRLLAGELAPVRGERVYGLGGQVQRSAVRARQTLTVVGPDAEAYVLTRDWAQTVQDLLLAGFEGNVRQLSTPTPAAVTRLHDVVALTGVAPLLARDPRTLSHGQRRRVLLARALMPAPELLLLDEFTDGLSGTARTELGRVLTRIHASGVAVILATHRPAEAPTLPWRTLQVQEGHVGEAEAPAAVTAAPFALPRPARGGPLVMVDRAEVYRNGQRALGPLSWTWLAGQHWLLSGENGSGKSTLARLIAGEFHPAVGGQVTRPFLARDVLSQRRRAVGLVSAELGVRQRRDWTGRDVMGSAFSGTEGFMAPLTPDQERAVDALAERLDLSALLRRNVQTLSQGQFRRLLLARAVVHQPTLLLLDEALDFLDGRSRALFLALLPDLARAGTHLLVVAHRPEDALPGLTHHLHLQDGRVAFSGPLQAG